MTPRTAEKKRWTAEEYLEMERAADEKHEFYQGEIFAMAGASYEHNLIVGNIAGELRNALRRRPCTVLPSDMKVRVAASGLYTYPDVTALCGPPQFADSKKDVLLNPGVIFEVLSTTTESYDRGAKFQQYRTIPSLAELAFVSQTKVLVEHFTRQEEGTWLLRERHAGDQLQLRSLDCEIAVDEIYLKVFELAATESLK